MMERAEVARIYCEQGGHPLPIVAGGKELALNAGTRAIYERRQPTAREIARFWPVGTAKNIALLLGPACRILAVNLNVKHGLDGHAALRGYPLPATPAITTASGGLCLFFRVPDRERYPALQEHAPENLR
jgi:Bifunctional DNA primase/polymerase, N-terminal